MDYIAHITTEHSIYTRAEPKRTVLKMSRGRVTEGWVYFPSGPAGTLHAVILRASLQIAPVDRDQSYALDDVIAPLRPAFDLHQPPFQVTVLTWNTSTQYDHVLTISLTLDPFFGKPPKRPFLASIFNRQINHTAR